MSPPRVTLGIAAYNGERYLAEAIESCLAQDYSDYELLIVDDASTDSTPAIIARYAEHLRVRVVTHGENRGIAAAYNSIVAQARGELIARLGHDDVAVEDRLRRQVAVFDAHPDTGVVHGDAVTIDGAGRVVGEWRSGDFDREALLHLLVRRHNYLVDPTTMIHRRVYEQVGGYDAAFPMCNDFDLWLRAAPRFRFRHCGGGPLIRYRRHADNFSDESARAREVDEVSRALAAAIAREDWRLLAPEAVSRAGALVLLADALDRRALPLPGLAARLRREGLHGRRRIVMTSADGCSREAVDPVARELARRGYDVTVFDAGGGVDASQPYQVREWWHEGVRVVGVGGPLAPAHVIGDAPATRAFVGLLDRIRPDAVHFRGLRELGAVLIDHAAVRGIRSLMTADDDWLACPSGDLDEIRGRVARGLDVCLVESEAMRAALIDAGYPADAIEVADATLPTRVDALEAYVRGERSCCEAVGTSASLAGVEPLELDPARLRLLATPAWRGDDRLGELLAAWVAGVPREAGACLFLLADPRTAPGEQERAARVLAAAPGAAASLDAAADVVILTHPLAGGEESRLHAAVDGYVPLHAACAGHERLARATGRPVLEPTAAALASWAGASRRRVA